MSDARIAAWESELKMLVEQMRSHPSDDYSADRARMAMLEKLIADYHKYEDG